MRGVSFTARVSTAGELRSTTSPSSLVQVRVTEAMVRMDACWEA